MQEPHQNQRACQKFNLESCQRELGRSPGDGLDLDIKLQGGEGGQAGSHHRPLGGVANDGPDLPGVHGLQALHGQAPILHLEQHLLAQHLLELAQRVLVCPLP